MGGGGWRGWWGLESQKAQKPFYPRDLVTHKGNPGFGLYLRVSWITKESWLLASADTDFLQDLFIMIVMQI